MPLVSIHCSMHVLCKEQGALQKQDLVLAHAQQEVLRSIWLTKYEAQPNNELTLHQLYLAAKCSDPGLLDCQVGQATMRFYW